MPDTPQARRLRQLRTRAGLTQHDLAGLLGPHLLGRQWQWPQTISAAEQGRIPLEAWQLDLIETAIREHQPTTPPAVYTGTLTAARFHPATDDMPAGTYLTILLDPEHDQPSLGPNRATLTLETP